MRCGGVRVGGLRREEGVRRDERKGTDMKAKGARKSGRQEREVWKREERKV